MDIAAEKISVGVYRFRLGTPEKCVPTAYRKMPALPYGSDQPCPFTAGDIQYEVTNRGLMVSLPLQGQVYGFGLQLKGLNHTRMKRTMRSDADAPSCNGESHAPVPFYVTTAHYGVMVDTARNAAFYCGQTKLAGESVGMGAETYLNPMTTAEQWNDYVRRDAMRMRIEIPFASGVDVYVFAGDSMMEAVQKYNMFSGGGARMPEWALGVWYRMLARSTAKDWEAFAQKFRDEGFPVTVLGLEPGWQTHAYACTYVWDEARLGDYRKAIEKIHELGYRVNAWEHGFVHPDSPIYDEIRPYCGDYETWGGLVPDFSTKAADIFLRRQLSLGVDCFKIDEVDGSDYNHCWSFPDFARFPGGMDGEQMHNMMGVLYQQMILRGFPQSVNNVRGAHALAAPYPFILYSDLYGHEDFIRGIVNAGFSGLLWAPEVRHAENPRDLIRRMQTALFSPQMLINAWYLKNPPWEQIDIDKNMMGQRMEDADVVTELARKLCRDREKLIPYLKRMYDQYAETGKPVFRALVLDCQDDAQTYAIDDEYMVGDNYLFAPLTCASDTRNVYLPEGRWMRDGVMYSSGWHCFTCDLSEYLLFEAIR